MDAYDYYRIASIQQTWRRAMADAKRHATEAAEARAKAQKG